MGLLTALGSASVVADDGHPTEQSVCGAKESFAFWLWRHGAGHSSPPPKATDLSDITFRTSDGRTLVGYRLAASSGAGPEQARGALLFAGGNAMLASQVVD